MKGFKKLSESSVLEAAKILIEERIREFNTWDKATQEACHDMLKTYTDALKELQQVIPE